MMSTELATIEGRHGTSVTLINFNGGEGDGECLQISFRNDASDELLNMFASFTMEQVHELLSEMENWLECRYARHRASRGA
jgi:hypothetical protein